MGLFGVSEVFALLDEKVAGAEMIRTRAGLVPSGPRVRIGKCGATADSRHAVGFFVGLFPGGGATVLSYSLTTCEALVGKPRRILAGAPSAACGAGSGGECGDLRRFRSALDAGFARERGDGADAGRLHAARDHALDRR